MAGLLPAIKPAVFVGSSRRDLQEFPAAVRREIGQALFEAQLGDHPARAKPLKGFGSGVLEIRNNYDGDTFRAVYTVRFEDVLYVLHTFQKKSTRGIATPQRHLDLIRQRLREAETIHRATKGARSMKKKKLPAFEVGSGNIFADLGLPNAEEHLLKAALVVPTASPHQGAQADADSRRRKLAGIKQPDLSNILRGHFQGFSVERLMRMLTAFDQDIEITVRPRRRKKGETGEIRLVPAEAAE